MSTLKERIKAAIQTTNKALNLAALNPCHPSWQKDLNDVNLLLRELYEERTRWVEVSKVILRTKDDGVVEAFVEVRE